MFEIKCFSRPQKWLGQSSFLSHVDIFKRQDMPDREEYNGSQMIL